MANELQTLQDIGASGNLNPVQAKRLQELSGEMSMGNPEGIAGSRGTYLEKQYLTEPGLLNRNTKQYNQAIQPAVTSYEQTLPEIRQRFQTERERLTGESSRLEERYKSLIDDIKRNQGVAENRQTLTTNNELARRGITNSSGVYQQEMTNTLNPITEAYTSQLRTTNLDREDQLANIRDMITGLVGGETDATRAITQAIANLQSGAGQQAVEQTNTDIRNRINDSMNLRQYNEVTLPESRARLQSAQIQNDIAKSLGGLAKSFGF